MGLSFNIVEEFECRDASCRPPTSGGTGGSISYSSMSTGDLDLLYSRNPIPAVARLLVERLPHQSAPTLWHGTRPLKGVKVGDVLDITTKSFSESRKVAYEEFAFGPDGEDDSALWELRSGTGVKLSDKGDYDQKEWLTVGKYVVVSVSKNDEQELDQVLVLEPQTAVVASAGEYPLARIERNALVALRSLAQRHLSSMGVTAAGIDPLSFITEGMEVEYLTLAMSLWEQVDDALSGFGLDTLPLEDFYAIVKDSVEASRNQYIDTIKSLIGKQASGTPTYGEFFFVPDYIPGTGLKPPLPYEVQFGDIRSVLGTLGGGGPSEAPLSTGITGGRILQDVLRENGLATNDKLWLYGETARRTFNGHLQVDGLVFSDWRDEALEIAPQDRWLRTDRYRPGDHWGCACVVVPYVPNFGDPFPLTVVADGSTEEFYNPIQPRDGDGQWTSYKPGNDWGYDGVIPDYTAKNGAVYTFKHDERRSLSALRNGKVVGFINWQRKSLQSTDPDYTVGKVHRIQVSGAHRHKGLATALWERARVIEPTLEHSHALTDDGKGWVASLGRATVASVGPVDEFYSPDQARDREGRWTAHRGRLTSLSSERIERTHGKGPDAMFGNSQTTTTIPWPTAPRLKGKRQYDPDLVQKALADPVIEKVDPRLLYGTQPSIVRSHFDHYYAGSPGLAADQHQASNAHPIVYVNVNGQHLLLSGHHRAAVALSKGDDLDAIVVRE